MTDRGDRLKEVGSAIARTYAAVSAVGFRGLPGMPDVPSDAPDRATADAELNAAIKARRAAGELPEAPKQRAPEDSQGRFTQDHVDACMNGGTRADAPSIDPIQV